MPPASLLCKQGICCPSCRETKESAKHSACDEAQSPRSDLSSDCRLGCALLISCSCHRDFNEATADAAFRTTTTTCNGLFSQRHGPIGQRDSKSLRQAVVAKASGNYTRSSVGSS